MNHHEESDSHFDGGRSCRSPTPKKPTKGPLQLDDLIQVAKKLEMHKQANDDALSSGGSTSSSPLSSIAQSAFLSDDEARDYDSDVSSLCDGSRSSSHVMSGTSLATESIYYENRDSSDGKSSAASISTITSSISSPSDTSCYDVSDGTMRNLTSAVLGIFSTDPRLPKRHRSSLSSFRRCFHSSPSASDDSSDDSTTRTQRRRCIPFHQLVQAKDFQRRASSQDKLLPLSSTTSWLSQVSFESHPSPPKPKLINNDEDATDTVLLPSASLTTRPCSKLPPPPVTTRTPGNSRSHIITTYCIPGTAATSSSTTEWYMSYSASTLSGIMNSYVPKYAAIVDVGCGASALCRELVWTGYSNVTGIDTCASAIATQQINGALLESFLQFRQVDARDLDRTFGVHSVDCIVAKATFDLVSSSDRLDMLTACVASLRPGGVLLWVSCQVEESHDNSSCWWLNLPISSLLNMHLDHLCTEPVGPLVGPPTGHAPAFTAKVFRIKESPTQRSKRCRFDDTQLVERQVGWHCVVYRKQLQRLDDEFDALIAREGPQLLSEDWCAHVLRQTSYDDQNTTLIDAYTIVVEEEMRVDACHAMACQDIEAHDLHVVWCVLDAVEGIVCALHVAHAAAQAVRVQERTDIVAQQVLQLVGLAVSTSETAREMTQATWAFVSGIVHDVLDNVVGNHTTTSSDQNASPQTASDQMEADDIMDQLPELSSQDADINEVIALKKVSKDTARVVPTGGTRTSVATETNDGINNQVLAAILELVAQVTATTTTTSLTQSPSAFETCRNDLACHVTSTARSNGEEETIALVVHDVMEALIQATDQQGPEESQY
ncbi:hypothetical protein DYB36_006199 [Aphanomyces astaci]|uniref:Methyltransferase type 11 domain-containing protein n=1 Tax=Aphanomyces astaci TaxID=112090 RepID=A0A397F6W7_APHAT|nr:hypothetical protein DYB36_006199 [Aphanomyces astaci]RHZ18170.1 hypothetical protein DYB31_003594 [Aphanomyces astaci]